MRVRPPRPTAFLSAGLLVFTSCARDADDFNPQIVITAPASGAVTPDSKLEVKGYVWDDKGVQKLVLQGSQDLMAKPPLSNQRGKKLVRFSFPLPNIEVGENRFELRAVDVNGRSAKRELELNVDAKKPVLSDLRLEGEVDSVTVSGRAEDNIKVSKVIINGTPLNIAPNSSVVFYASVPRTRVLNIVIEDSVGNRIEEIRYPPAPPAPPPPEPSTTNQGTNTQVGAAGTTQTPRRRRRRRRVVTPQPPAQNQSPANQVTSPNPP